MLNMDELEEPQVRAHVASMLEAWVREPGVSDEERVQRQEAAHEMERALLHKIRFASDQEEMAWLIEKAAEAGKLVEFEAWLAEKSLDTPGKVWTARPPLELALLRQLGPHMQLANMALLTSLPNGLHVDGDLNLEGCSGLTSLANNLHVDGGLDLKSCTGLTSLPHGLHVSGHLNLQGCSSLTPLPDNLRVYGDLDFFDSTGLTSLPDGLHVDGDLDLGFCTGLASLPDGLHVGGTLHLRNCTGLTSLPDGLHVDGHLDLESCTSLATLPDGLHVGGNLNLIFCDGLTSVPDNMHVNGDLILDSCTALTSLPNNLHAKGDLDLFRCTSLTSLPDGLRVGGYLNLKGCTSLVSLTDGLRVGGGLRLDGCTILASLPDGLHVGGFLDLAGCKSLTSLPDSVLEWGMCSTGEPHNIYLYGSDLPPEELARLQALNSPALRFFVSFDERFGGAGLSADDFPTLDAAAAFWAKEAALPAELVISPFVETPYVRGVLGFLSKLRRAKEFNNTVTKRGLASRVVQVLEMLTCEDNGVREELVVRMADAVDTCSDKPLWALNQMSVLVHIAEARGDRAKLRALGVGVMRLEVVHRHVRKAMDAMNFIDDVCVYLRFEIALRESLQLPVSALEMLYPSYITVSEESIAAAETEALLLTDQNFDAWLPNWSEGQRQDRVEFADNLDFSALEHNTAEGLSGVLDNNVADPVRLKPLATVWSLQDLLKHWVNTGMDLNNTPRDVDYMRLNLTKCI